MTNIWNVFFIYQIWPVLKLELFFLFLFFIFLIPFPFHFLIPLRSILKQDKIIYEDYEIRRINLFLIAEFTNIVFIYQINTT